MKYRVLDDIAYFEPLGAGESAVRTKKVVTATQGDVVEIADKDAAPLLKRGAIVADETKE